MANSLYGHSMPDFLEKVNPETMNATAFETLKRAFERAPRDPDLLNIMGNAVAASVIRRLCDPDARRAALDSRASNAGMSPAMQTLRRERLNDAQDLVDLADCMDKATRLVYNADGDLVRETVDKGAEKRADALSRERLGDGVDLAQEAIVALLDVADRYADGGEWLDKPISVRRIARRVYVDATAVPEWKDADSTPIQEVYRAVRRYVDKTRAVQTDPRNGYAYLADLATDPDSDALETVYRRIGKYADMGGYVCTAAGGGYAVDRETVDRYNATLAVLDLTDRQGLIVSYRMRGYGLDAIAEKIGVSLATVKRAVADMQDRAVANGLAPRGYNPDDRKGDAPRAVVQIDRAGATVARYDSAAAAAKATETDAGAIRQACKGTRRTAGGYAWKYAD